MQIPKIEYEIYSKLNGSNLVKLNLSICNTSKISLLIPVEISQTLDKLNTSSDYFNNICYTTTSENGTDISLKDRQNEFIKQNKAVCQDDCELYNYNYTTKKANCSCKPKESPLFFSDMHINKTKLYNNFIEIKNVANINILSCYKKLLTKDGIIYNIGSYIGIAIIIFHIISIIIFYAKQYKNLKKIIKDIVFAIKNLSLVKDVKKKNKKNNNEIKMKNNKQKKESSYKKRNKLNKNENNKNKSSYKSIKLSDNTKKNKNSQIIETNNTINNNLKPNNRRRHNLLNNLHSNFNNKSLNKKNKSKTKAKNIKLNNTEKIKEKIKGTLKYTEEEKNFLDYHLAIKHDKRKYCKYYISLLKTQHEFIFSFIQKKDYNARIIKFDLYFISFIIYYTVNGLFFDDKTMHNIYEKKGSFDFEYQIPKIIYSSLISMVINKLLRLLALSNNALIRLKENKNKKDVDKRKNELEKNISIRFIIFFILSFLLLLCFWYYIAMFGAIYRNTQMHLFKDTLISFGLSSIYPFVIYLFPGMFRIPALFEPKAKKKCLYDFSKFLQIL